MTVTDEEKFMREALGIELDPGRYETVEIENEKVLASSEPRKYESLTTFELSFLVDNIASLNAIKLEDTSKYMRWALNTEYSSHMLDVYELHYKINQAWRYTQGFTYVYKDGFVYTDEKGHR